MGTVASRSESEHPVVQSSKVGMISANVSGWDRAASYWQGTSAAPAAPPPDPKTQDLLDRHESLVAELDSIERAIETQAQIVVGRATKAAASKRQPRTEALTKFRHRDPSTKPDEPAGRQIWPAIIVALFLTAAILAVVTLRAGNGNAATLDLPVIPIDSPANPYTTGRLGAPIGTEQQPTASADVELPVTAADQAPVLNPVGNNATFTRADELAVASVQPSPTSVRRMIPIVVQPGESVEYFADVYGTPVETITSINGLDDSSLIFAGQMILIPLGFDY
jgi:hypothetical protein